MELKRDFYVGVVEENLDSDRKGGIKVRVETLYNTIPVEDLPYAYPLAGLAGKSFEIPAIGKLVNILFFSDDIYSPYYIYSENFNVNLQNKLKNINDDEYVRFVALLFDDRTQIYSSIDELVLDHYFNKIAVTKWGINLELKDNKQNINLGSKNSDQQAVLGTRFFEWMDKFIDELNSPFSLIGNLGAPIMKPKLNKLCTEYKTLRPDFVSNNVYVVDNREVDTLDREALPHQNDTNLNIPNDELECDGSDPAAINRQKLQENIDNQNNNACSEISTTAPKPVGSIPDPEDIPEPTENEIIFKVIRHTFLTDRTLGKLYVNDTYLCDTLEDKVRDLKTEQKVYGQTAIPYGVYKLTVGPTGLSKRTAPTGRLPLVNKVPYFEGIRIHKWGKPESTEGCLLVGKLNTNTNSLTNYDEVSKTVTDLCEKYQRNNKKMTIVYTKDEEISENKKNNETFANSEYIKTDEMNPNCIRTKTDDSWNKNLEMTDFETSGETLSFAPDEDLLITKEQLSYIMPKAQNSAIEKFLMPINATLKKYNITTPLQICAFMSQIATESGNLKWTKELGGPIYFKKYEFRQDLGNTEKGDGVKYFGRGLIQVTGKANYSEQSSSLGQDFINNPEMLEQPMWASLSAGLWWKKREGRLSSKIENKDIKGITKIVNGGYNGLSERTEFYNRALKAYNV